MKKNILILKGLFSIKKSIMINILVLVLLAGLPMCKTVSQENGDQFTLSVVLGEGVTGTPANGSTIYSDGAVVNYDYQLKADYHNLIVTLDGVQVESEGTLIMDKNHSLNVSASNTEFTLTVNAGDGVTGTPVSGTETYSPGETVSYEYQLIDGYGNLIVLLDGTQVENTGIITMNGDHSLNITAVEGYDITGDWDLELTISKAGSNASILETINVSLEFSGMANSGSIFINGQNVGSYSVQNSDISFFYTIADPILGQLKYDYTGEFTTNDTMGGDVIVYKITVVSNNVNTPMAEVVVKRGVWSGKRKKK